MSFGQAVGSCFRQFAGFQGRARRAEYWWWVLFQALVTVPPYVAGLIVIIAGAGDPDTGEGTDGALLTVGVVLLVLFALVSLALFLPTLAVLVRRLHDSGRSGWWYFIAFVPGGSLVLLVFAILDGTPGPNAHGPDPKGRDPVAPAPGGYPPYGQPASPYGQPASPYGQAASPYGQAASPYGQPAPPYGHAPDPYGGYPPPPGSRRGEPLPPPQD